MATYTFEWNFLSDSLLIKQFKFAKPNTVLYSNKFIYKKCRFYIECTPNGYQPENVTKGRCALWLAIDKTPSNVPMIDVTVTFSCNAINYYVSATANKMGRVNSGYPSSLSSNITSKLTEYLNLSNWTFRCNIKINATHKFNPHHSLSFDYNDSMYPNQYNNKEETGGPTFTIDWNFAAGSPALHQFKFAQQNDTLQSNTFIHQKCGFLLECTPNGYVASNISPGKCLLWLAIANLPDNIEAIDVMFAFTCNAINYHTSGRCNKMGRSNSGYTCSYSSLVTSDLVDYLNLSQWTFTCSIKILQQYTLRPHLLSAASNIAMKSDIINANKRPEYMNALNSSRHHKKVNVLSNIFESILKDTSNKKYQNLNIKRIANTFRECDICMVLLYQAGFEKSDDGKRLLYDINDLNQLKSIYKNLVTLRDEASQNTEEKDWQCPVCTLINNGQQQNCIACGSQYSKAAFTQKLSKEISTILGSNEIVSTIDSKHLLQITDHNLTEHKSNNNESKCDLFSCHHLKQLITIFTKYHVFIREQIEQKNDCDLNKIYDVNQSDLSVLNDFHHLLLKHYDQFEGVYNLLKKTCNNKNVCTLSKCLMFRRNYRDRTYSKNKCKQLNAMYFVTNELAMDTQQILDKIHCFYFHSFDIGYKLTRKEKQYILNQCSEQKQDDFTFDPISNNIYKIIVNKSELNKNVKEVPLANRANKFKTNIVESHYQTLYDLGYRYFYWKYYEGKFAINDEVIYQNIDDPVANEGYCINDFYVIAKYENLKTELINNAICGIDYGQWKNLLSSASTHLQSDFARTITCAGPDRKAIYDIEKGELIGLEHIIAMMVYCNYDQVQSEFSATYRQISGNEDYKHVIQRHTNYAHLGRLLREFVECFGSTGCGGTQLFRKKLYHVMIIKPQFATIKPVMKGPTSTTMDYAIAVNFSGGEGTILELGLHNGWSYSSHSGDSRMAFIDCSWLSDYPNEQERFFIGGWKHFYFNTIMIASSGQNYQHYIDAMRAFAISTSTLGLHFDVTETTLQMFFRIFSHILWTYYGFNAQKQYHKFGQMPVYGERLLHNFCANVKILNFWGASVIFNSVGFPKNYLEKLRKMIRFWFFNEYGWVNLNELTTVFPRVKEIYLNIGDGLKIITNGTTLTSVASVVNNTRVTGLKKIVINLGPINEECANVAMDVIKKTQQYFVGSNWSSALVTQNKAYKFLIYDQSLLSSQQENKPAIIIESDIHHHGHNASHNIVPPQISPETSSIVESTESLSDKGSMPNSSSPNIYYQHTETTSNSETLSMPNLVLSSDDMAATENETPASYNNVIQTLLSSMVTIIHNIHSWEASVSSYSSEFEAFENRLRNTNDPNNIIAFGPGKQNAKHTTKLNGDNYNEKTDGNGDQHNNDSNNNDNIHHNHRQNNKQDEKKKPKENRNNGDYICNIPRHKHLEQMVNEQNEEIKRLRIELQRERERNSLLQKKILSIPTDIKQNEYGMPCKTTEQTVMDGLYRNMKCKDNVSTTRISEIKRIFKEQEYDSEALTVDILEHDIDQSNIAKFINSYTEYSSIQQYMQQNAKHNTSPLTLDINPSMKLTQKTIPNQVEQTFVNVNDFMRKYILLHGSQAMIECNNGKNVVIDYNFHRKQQSKETETESLYVICDRSPKRHKYLPSLSSGVYGKFALNPTVFEWKMRDKLFTENETKKICNLTISKMPRTVTKQSMLMKEIHQTMQRIKCALKNDKMRNKLIKSKGVKWNRSEKIPIITKKSRKSGLSLKLSKQEFIKRLCAFNDKLPRNNNNIIYDINLIPIIRDKHFEIIWIASIGKDINIGISVKLQQNVKYEWLMPLGIYLDINDLHKLVPYKQHKCKCLTNFICCIDELKIGNEPTRINQKYNTLQKKLYNVQQNIKSNDNLRKMHYVDTPSNSENDEKSDCYDENNNKCQHAMDTHQESSASHSYLVPSEPSTSVPSTTTTSVINEQQNEQCLDCKCLAFTKLNIAEQYIQSLEAQQKMDRNTIKKIKNEAMKWDVLLQQQNELQIQTIHHQQIIDSLMVMHQTTIPLSNEYDLPQQQQHHDTH